jgi:hypothetical protein
MLIIFMQFSFSLNVFYETIVVDGWQEINAFFERKHRFIPVGAMTFCNCHKGQAEQRL